MNYRLVSYIIGWVLRFEGIFLLLPMFVSIIYGEHQFQYYLLTAVLCYGLGMILTNKKVSKKLTHAKMYTREGFVSVALSWIVMSIFGAFPFVLTGEIPSYVDALFETISGFTTTGASILSDVEALSHGNLFWRSFTHWIGGMGVFVFMMAIVPLAGGSIMNLMKAESPGPSVDKLVPHVKDTSKILYSIYLVITVVEIILLCIWKMPVFDAITISFGTVGTGGFGIKNDSMAGYSPAIQNIVTIFMIASGVNYGAYFLLLSKKVRSAFKMEEVRWYFVIILVVIGILCIDTGDMYSSMGETLRHAAFQVGSIITTTGYSTYDFDLWPQLSKTVLIILMFIGACAGSTGGGMKVSRILIVFKAIRKELSLLIHPRQIKRIIMDDHPIAHEVVRSTNVFISIYFCILFISVLLIGIDEKDFTTNFTAVVATLNNIGPGMDMVGPTRNFSFFSGFSKCVMMFDMLAGRLELFPMLILFYPSAWKKK